MKNRSINAAKISIASYAKTSMRPSRRLVGMWAPQEHSRIHNIPVRCPYEEFSKDIEDLVGAIMYIGWEATIVFGIFDLF